MHKRKEPEKLDELVKNGRKKWVRYDEGADLYSMGIHSFMNLAKYVEVEKTFQK